MILKNVLKYLILLPVIFFFLPAFAFDVPFLRSSYLYYNITIYVALFIIFLTQRKTMRKILTEFYKHSLLKLFAVILFLIVLNAIILILFGVNNFGLSARTIIIHIILFIIPNYLYYLFIINKLTFNKFIRLFVILFWISLVLGFISYIGDVFHINIISSFFDFFANWRKIILEKYNVGGQIKFSGYESFGALRLDNLHDEPAHYARFLYIFLPFTYSISRTKQLVLNNSVLNKIIKKTIVPFTIISVILTMSPIYLILSILLTVLYYRKKIIKYIYALPFVLIFFITNYQYIYENLENTFISRIFKVFEHSHSFLEFMTSESSLATRIINYINTFIIFLKHPLTGVGYGNLSSHLINQLLASPVPLTPEINLRIYASMQMGRPISFNRGFIYLFLAENGIIIFTIFVYFYYRLYKSISKTITTFPLKHNSIEYTTLFGLKWSLISLLFLSFYEMDFILLELHWVICLSLYLIFMSKKMSETKEESVNA